MFYIFLRNNTVHEVIPEEATLFPGVPIQERYSPAFLAKCVPAADAIPTGYIYDPKTNTFTAPPEPEPEPEEPAE